MINSLVAFALRNRALMLVLFVMTMIGGVIGFRALNIEAYPDPVPPYVNIITQAPGLSAEEMERYVTIPIETQVAAVQNLRIMRSVSLYGLSDIKLQFTYDFTYDQALQEVLNKLSQLSGLPDGVQPQINPVSPIGEIFRYKLSGPPGYSVLELKTLQDWVLQRKFRAVPGVVDVIGWGGKTKTFDLQIDLNKLVAYGLTLPQVLQTIKNSNVNVGGNVMNIGSQAAVVRGVGLIQNIDDLKNTMLTNVGGNPVLVRDVAEVIVGYKQRLGIAGRDDDDDIVQGIVLMRRGQQSTPTIARVKAQVETINNSGILPPGVKIERIYDRQDLINVTTHTVLHNMLFGVILIFLLQWVFLGDLRSALIVAATIPFALFFAIGLMLLRGESANLLSVGAIDFGLIVDATVIMVERIFRQLEHPANASSLKEEAAASGFSGKLLNIYFAATKVNRSILFAALVVIAGFIPLFTMSGVEGHIFGPMAKTYAYALAGGLLATFTIAPAFSAYLLPEKVRETETRIVSWLSKQYRRALEAAMGHARITIGATLMIVLVAGVSTQFLGFEFLPKLEEGNMWIRATMPSTISLEEGNVYANRMRAVIRKFPEVETVVSQHGRPDDGTDAAGFFNAEFFAPLKPFDRWRSGLDKEKLISEIKSKLEAEFPGVEFSFSQYLQDNVAEQASGVKGENSIKIFGNNLTSVTETANQIMAVLNTVPGITDLGVLTSLGQPTVQIEINREAAARYGLSTGDVNAAIRTAVGGEEAGFVYEPDSDRRFPIVVRLAPQFRKSAELIGRLTIAVQSNGAVTQIPLSEIARIKLVSGPFYIYREQQDRYLPIKFSVRDRDLGSAVLEAQERVAKEIRLPAGSRLEWVGEFRSYQDAIGRLQLMVPLCFVLIGILLWINFGSVRDTVLAMSVIPMAVVGGIFALLLLQIPFSVSAAIGFVALFGIAVMNGIMILSQYNRLIEDGLDRVKATLRAGELQMRPVLMTCVIAAVGLFPAAISSGIGSQVQKPLAVVVVGGMLFTPLLVLIALPVLIRMYSRRAPAGSDTAQ